MKTLLVLIIVGVLGFFGYKYFVQNNPRTSDVSVAVSNTTERVKEGARDLKQKASSNLNVSWDANSIKDELAKSGRVVRQKMQKAGAAISDATADARTTTAIKGKYVADTDLSAMSISVNTTDGVVTLSGTAPSHEAIAKAMKIALDQDGVREVVSTLQVKEKKS